MNLAKWIVLALALGGLPLVAGDFYVNLTSQIFIAAIFAASLNLLVGYGGLVSLGHASWIGLAAYISAWLSLKFGLGHWMSAPAALIGTTLIAGVFLFLLGSGPVKGFAVVHCLGILTSMYSAVMVSRAMVNLWYGRQRKLDKVSIGQVWRPQAAVKG